MSDIVKDATEYRIKQIEIAEANFYRTLTQTLDRIEREVVALVNKDLHPIIRSWSNIETNDIRWKHEFRLIFLGNFIGKTLIL